MKRINVGITGQSGFIGNLLFNYLGTKNDIERISFQKEFFLDTSKLDDFVKKCDVIVHLAALNRHYDEKILYETNKKLVKNLIEACIRMDSKPHIIFSSSTQEERNNSYGKSKREGRKLLESWAKTYNAKFTGLLIPNVFGPFGKPNYNSFIATFCYQLTHQETPVINNDVEVKLIFSNELVEVIYNKINEIDRLTTYKTERFIVKPSAIKNVSEILDLLREYKSDYFDYGIIPDLSFDFEKNLFNTFRCYISNDHYPFRYDKHTDPRGSFVEVAKVYTSGQFSYSTTKPGITRGNHYHTRKAERFAVIKGKAQIQLRRIGTQSIINYELDGENPSYVDMPIWTTHNITNIGKEELVTLFWINEPYNHEDPDTYFEEV